MSTLIRTMPEDEQRTLAIREMLRETSRLDYSLPPPVLTARLQALLRNLSGIDDPYAHEKHLFTQMALDILPKLQNEVAAASDPFLEALRMAVVGNVIDFGAKHNLTQADALRAIHAAAKEPVHGEPEELEGLARRASSILYLADNAGESVLDTLLLSRLPQGRVTIAVRGVPILNDVTKDDAILSGMHRYGPIVENGSDVPGTHLEDCSEEFVNLFRSSDLIISKGQGNYETLLGERAPVFFLFRVKCPLVAELTGHPLNGNVAMKSPLFTGRFKSGPR